MASMHLLPPSHRVPTVSGISAHSQSSLCSMTVEETCRPIAADKEVVDGAGKGRITDRSPGSREGMQQLIFADKLGWREHAWRAG